MSNSHQISADSEKERGEDRILVVSPAWVGDMVMAQTLYKVLRKRHPNSKIDVMAPQATLPLVSRMPEISRGIKFDLAHGELGIGKRKLFGKALIKNEYRQAIILPNSLKSALVPFYADIPKRTGFRGEFRYALINDMRMLNKRTLPRMIDRFACLGFDIGAELPELENPSLMVNEHNKNKLIERFELDLSRPVMAICPGAEFGDAKKWPENHYAKLLDLATERGMQVWIFGGPKDQATAKDIEALATLDNLAFCHDFTGKTSLLDVIDLLSLCQLVVSNDSGLMHIAAAVGAQTAVIYGSTSPEFTPPLTDKLDIATLGLSCSPCFKRTCPLKHKNCLVNLKPELLIPIIEQHCDVR
ncbi:MAG: heptosyltransferase-2 [Candidatus Azotimanducaceae bacterium]|jgi:heptosyltransferase-2